MNSSVLPGWERFFEGVEQLITTMDRNREGASAVYCDYILERMGMCIVTLSRLIAQMEVSPTRIVQFNQEEIDTIVSYQTLLRSLLENVRVLTRDWQQHQVLVEAQSVASAYRSPTAPSSSRGRPKFHIEKRQLEYLSSMSFNWTQIADMLGVSRILYRRRVEYGLTNSTVSDMISDDDLHTIVCTIRREAPVLGESMLLGRLRSMGVQVTRSRVRDCTRSIDPIGASLRWSGQLIRRQPYSVPGPNSLWHIGKSKVKLPVCNKY